MNWELYAWITLEALGVMLITAVILGGVYAASVLLPAVWG